MLKVSNFFVIDSHGVFTFNSWTRNTEFDILHFIFLIFCPRLPWVFTFNSWTRDPEYEEMLKIAVKSSQIAKMTPAFCLFSGERDASIVKWLQDEGVSVVHVSLNGFLRCCFSFWCYSCKKLVCLPHEDGLARRYILHLS
jgi:thiol-disulfide isomerase/thioredoxin